MLIVSRRNAKNDKNARRQPTKHRNCENMLIVGRRNAKNIENRPSSMDESEKMPKNGFPPRLKSKK